MSQYFFWIALGIAALQLNDSQATPNKDVTDGIVALLQKHHQAGGIARYSVCNASSESYKVNTDVDVATALREIPAGAHLLWRFVPENNTYLSSIAHPSSQQLLEVMLPTMVLHYTNLDQAVDALLDSKPVQEKELLLGITLRDQGLGFAALPQDQNAFSVNLPQGTLEEDLNRIAAANRDPAIWLYIQDSCNNRSVASFHWVNK